MSQPTTNLLDFSEIQRVSRNPSRQQGEVRLGVEDDIVLDDGAQIPQLFGRRGLEVELALQIELPAVQEKEKEVFPAGELQDVVFLQLLF